MNTKRIILYLADSYLHGFLLEDPEYIEIIRYLKKEIKDKSSLKKREKLEIILGEENILTSRIYQDTI